MWRQRRDNRYISAPAKVHHSNVVRRDGYPYYPPLSYYDLTYPFSYVQTMHEQRLTQQQLEEQQFLIRQQQEALLQQQQTIAQQQQQQAIAQQQQAAVVAPPPPPPAQESTSAKNYVVPIAIVGGLVVAGLIAIAATSRSRFKDSSDNVVV